MRIISNFKDYYDFAGFTEYSKDYKETVYIRKTELKIAGAVLESVEIECRRNYQQYDKKIISGWWEKNKNILSLSDTPVGVRSGCLFVCGKAYPFLFLRGTAQIGAEGKAGQIRISRFFNNSIKNSVDKKLKRAYWENCEKDGKYEDDFNFFKVYYSIDEFFEDVSVAHNPSYYFFRCRTDEYYMKEYRKEFKKFLEFYDGKDFTAFHLKLDSPLFLTLFQTNGVRYGEDRREYEFILNPNLYEFDFVRVMSGEIMAQELDMFLGNVLVKDVMPQCYQSDLDKLTAHGFDSKISFRNIKVKK